MSIWDVVEWLVGVVGALMILFWICIGIGIVFALVVGIYKDARDKNRQNQLNR